MSAVSVHCLFIFWTAVDFLQGYFSLPVFLQTFTGAISSITLSFELNESRRRSTESARCHMSFHTSFIFGTQIKVFFMKSKSFLTLHRPTQLKCSQTQKHSKDINKWSMWHVMAQLQFCEATRILLVHKENKNTNLLNNSSLRVNVFLPFWRVPWSVCTFSWM